MKFITQESMGNNDDMFNPGGSENAIELYELVTLKTNS